jgi:hypothetical protein
MRREVNRHEEYHLDWCVTTCRYQNELIYYWNVEVQRCHYVILPRWKDIICVAPWLFAMFDCMLRYGTEYILFTSKLPRGLFGNDIGCLPPGAFGRGNTKSDIPLFGGTGTWNRNISTLSSSRLGLFERQGHACIAQTRQYRKQDFHFSSGLDVRIPFRKSQPEGCPFLKYGGQFVRKSFLHTFTPAWHWLCKKTWYFYMLSPLSYPPGQGYHYTSSYTYNMRDVPSRPTHGTIPVAWKQAWDWQQTMRDKATS